MTVLSSDLSARVAKLLPRLASDQQGEVAAVAAALTRTLKSGGCDLHDLAQHIAEGPREVIRYIHKPQEPPRAGPRDYGDWRSSWRDFNPRRRNKAQAAKVRAAPPGFLSPWESEFVGSLIRQMDQARDLTAKQQVILREIHARFEERYG